MKKKYQRPELDFNCVFSVVDVLKGSNQGDNYEIDDFDVLPKMGEGKNE